MSKLVPAEGKRFICFLLCLIMLLVGLFVGGELFGIFAGSVTGLYTAYLAGQTATDWREVK